MNRQSDRHSAEERFAAVFAHLGAVTAYARRRGSRDAEGIAAEVMTIAWRRLADVPEDDPRPWLYATARNLVWADARRTAKAREREAAVARDERDAVASATGSSDEVDPGVWRALRSLTRLDQEALLLVAWEELTPGQAATALGINPAAFRVRLLRARRRMRASLERGAAEDRGAVALAQVDLEGTR